MVAVNSFTSAFTPIMKVMTTFQQKVGTNVGYLNKNILLLILKVI